MQKISVVIGTLGRLETLKKTLRCLSLQDYPRDKFEIIIVSNKDEGIKEYVEEFAKTGIRTTFYLHQNPWVAAKRNYGVKKSLFEIIAFTDDDCLPKRNWLKKINEIFEKEKDVLAIEGKTIGKNTRLFYHATNNTKYGGFPTCNFAVRKKVFEEVNGFDEEHTYHREDTDLAFKILEKGKIKFAPSVIVRHPPRKIPMTSILKELRWVRGDVRLWKKFPKKYKEFYGFVSKGSFKQAIASWFLFILMVFSVKEMNVFRFIVSIKGKKGNLTEIITIIFFSFIRDLLFPLAFVYYMLKFANLKNVEGIT